MKKDKQMVNIQNKISFVDEKLTVSPNNKNLKNDRAILKEFVTFLQNKK